MESEDVDTPLEVNGDEAWAQPLVLDETFLIVREAAHNALTHGDPKIVRIRVNIAPHELQASIEDNGCGFTASDLSRSDGVGMSSMRERAELLGGALSVSSWPNSGTIVDLSVPL